MKRVVSVVATLWAALILCWCGNVFAQSGELSTAESESLEFLLLYSEMKQHFYEKTSEIWENQSFTGYASDEQANFENLKTIADQYGMEIPDEYWSCNIVLLVIPELDFYCSPLVVGWGWWGDWDETILVAAYFEELSIRELKLALEQTEVPQLLDAYTEMLSIAYFHLLQFAQTYHDDPLDYEAQLIDQADVDLALSEAISKSNENFVINPGLNDAWYEPATNGQGFFITVYPEKGTVFVGWFTFDMDFPGQDVIAGLGDACQRWLTAQGPYDGKRADLVVYNSSGGLFDSVLAVPQLEPIGSITLQFENCTNGTVSYDLPTYGLMGEIPIQRVASDNVAACRLQSYLSR